jgi:hypothetical protein
MMKSDDCGKNFHLFRYMPSQRIFVPLVVIILLPLPMKFMRIKPGVVGSIGVLMNGFGFVEAMNKLGIERRLLTAGEHKGFLDPFSPMEVEDVKHIKTVLNDIHDQFIKQVKQGREKRFECQGKATPVRKSRVVFWAGVDR